MNTRVVYNVSAFACTNRDFNRTHVCYICIYIILCNNWDQNGKRYHSSGKRGILSRPFPYKSYLVRHGQEVKICCHYGADCETCLVITRRQCSIVFSAS